MIDLFKLLGGRLWLADELSGVCSS
jgi:hypothetical protein